MTDDEWFEHRKQVLAARSKNPARSHHPPPTAAEPADANRRIGIGL